jgi:hypothetical protein
MGNPNKNPGKPNKKQLIIKSKNPKMKIAKSKQQKKTAFLFRFFLITV